MSKNGHLTLKTHLRKNKTLENIFWGQIPIFSPKKSAYFFQGFYKSIEVCIQMKKSRHRPPKMGIGPQKCLQKTNLLMKIAKKTLFQPDSFKKRHSEPQNHSLQILFNVIMKKTVFFWVLKVFFGSNTCYLMGDTHFFFSENIL